MIASADGGDSLLKILRYTDEDAEGEELDHDEWPALLSKQEAMLLPGNHPAQPHAWLWIFRKSFALDRPQILQELSDTCRQIGEPIQSPSGDTAFLVIESHAADLRETWASRAARFSEVALCQNDTGTALALAETAFHVGSLMTPQRLALLAFAYKRNGRETRADAYLKMAGRSMGAPFADEVRKELEVLSRSCPGNRALKPLVTRRIAALSKERLARHQEAAA